MTETIERLTLLKKQDRVYDDVHLCTQLQTSVPKTKSSSFELEGVPPNPLPTWVTLPLEAKLPMLPCPKKSVVLFTTNIGEKIHKRDPALEFDLTDPYSHVITNDYKPLHDPHLKHHLTMPQMRKRLRRGGFVTADGKVICSLKEYNDYRQYLRKINLMLERNKMQRETAKLATSQAKFNKVINTANDLRHSKVKEIKARLARQHEDDKQRYVRLLYEDDERVRRMRGDQMMKMIRCQRDAKEREELRIQMLQQKQYQDDLHRMNVIQTWMDDDAQRRQLADTRRRHKQHQRQKLLERSWELRKRIQQEKISEDLRRQASLDRQKRQRIEKRQLVLDKQLNKQQEQFQKMSQKRRSDRQVLEELYLTRFAAKIEKRRAISARRRERRRVARMRRYERLRPRSNWDIERSILQAIDEWGRIYSHQHIAKQQSSLRVFCGIISLPADSPSVQKIPNVILRL